MTAQRDRHIDALKGVAILLVVLGHSIQINDPKYDDNLLFRFLPRISWRWRTSNSISHITQPVSS
jgi:peptidoglycan/LPS O-acetylase OafA/YrhL